MAGRDSHSGCLAWSRAKCPVQRMTAAGSAKSRLVVPSGVAIRWRESQRAAWQRAAGVVALEMAVAGCIAAAGHHSGYTPRATAGRFGSWPAAARTLPGLDQALFRQRSCPPEAGSMDTQPTASESHRAATRHWAGGRWGFQEQKGVHREFSGVGEGGWRVSHAPRPVGTRTGASRCAEDSTGRWGEWFCWLQPIPRLAAIGTADGSSERNEKIVATDPPRVSQTPLPAHHRRRATMPTGGWPTSSWTPAGIHYTVEGPDRRQRCTLSPAGQTLRCRSALRNHLGGKLYIALATSHDPRTVNNPGANSFGAGDFPSISARTGSYEMGINIKNAISPQQRHQDLCLQSFGDQSGAST